MKEGMSRSVMPATTRAWMMSRSHALLHVCCMQPCILLVGWYAETRAQTKLGSVYAIDPSHQEWRLATGRRRLASSGGAVTDGLRSRSYVRMHGHPTHGPACMPCLTHQHLISCMRHGTARGMRHVIPCTACPCIHSAEPFGVLTGD